MTIPLCKVGLRGKKKNVLELPKNDFKHIKKMQIFHILGEGGRGVNQHMENSICFLHLLFESFPNQKMLLL